MTNIVKDIKEERLKLSFITLQGFKSINQEGQEISFGDITVLLGANGSGKSNLLSFFSMVEAMLKGSLQSYVAQNGFANTILHYGAKQTPKAAGEIYFSNLKDGFFYGFILSHTIDNTLLLQQEVVQRLKNEKPFSHFISPTYANNKESFLKTRFADMYANNENYKRIYWNGKQLTEVMSDLFRQCQIFQFHDTSKTSKIRSQIYVEDNHYLHNDGGNLAAFLYEMKINNEKYYKRIVRYIKQVMPQFGNFDLQPSKLNKRYIILNYREPHSDYLFGAHQISDGSLRFMCLATLLLQPPETLPAVVILDEPELGLHPAAISILAGMVRTASKHCQVILATQSTRLVDEFDANNIVIVERNEQEDCSEFKTLDEDKLQDWLERYSLSELWEKNVLGGRP